MSGSMEPIIHHINEQECNQISPDAVIWYFVVFVVFIDPSIRHERKLSS